MQAFYTIGEPAPLTAEELAAITVSLPEGYCNFLLQYGYGNINELLMFNAPDPGHIRDNFGEYFDFWEPLSVSEESLLNSLTIATTIDGDVIAVNNECPLIVLPRHGDQLLRFDSFDALIEYYDQRYRFGGKLYFDTYHQYRQEHFAFTDTALFEAAYAAFLKEISYDEVFNAAVQPKYVIQRMGGWVYFDAISKRSVRIKYQEQRRDQAADVLAWIARYR